MNAQRKLEQGYTYPPIIRELNVLRFFAAVWVVFFHFGTFVPLQSLQKFASAGHLAVDFFFILSGFVMSHVYLAASERGDFRPGTFVVHRFSRLYPVHVAVLAAYGALILIANLAGLKVDLPHSPEDLPAHLLLIHAWGTMDHLSWNVPSWSISAEWFAYLMFAAAIPLVAWAAKRPLLFLAATLALFLSANIALDMAGHTQLPNRSWDLGILRVVPEFLIGCALYSVGRSVFFGQILARWGLIMVLPLIGGAIWLDMYGFTIVILMCLVILFSAELSRDRRSNPLRSGVAFYLGEVSFSVYMVHALTFSLLFRALEMIGIDRSSVPLWAFVPLSAVVLLVAMGSYHLVEVPSRRYLRNAWARYQFKRAGRLVSA